MGRRTDAAARTLSLRTTVVDPDDLSDRIGLDVCSHYTSKRCLLVQDSVLLHQRVRADGFVVASKPSEFIYMMARVLRRTDVSTTEDLALGFPLPGVDVGPRGELDIAGPPNRP